ncbi:MAG TPA: DmsC/YnfH family molybdoenzyme membrane anchor subunit [Acidimicrobiales bacterium]|nr:DmsC/YnfH family molybdoenzyme membrane anchor subunit [Acidimicrobiales bacterium]
MSSATPLERYLAEQADLTPVERFSVVHDACAVPESGTWRDRIPLTAPAPGEQYAFDVDLDTCTGCKACVTACHNLNGLDEGESYRTVGLLTGGTPAQPFQQTVTTACHHCVDPACLNGCPTNAYEKDVFNGIVAHIEGRCLGCGYCTWTCPYEVPRFNSARGVVRKCDMCHDRLAVGEAPACVSACPNGAIRITVVNTAALSETVRGETLVPTAPPSGITLPTTSYHSDWGLPEGLRAAGATLGGHSHSHDPLVAMLVLTQAAAGALAVDLAVGHQRATAVTALGLAMVGLAISILHLGRPERAWRALAGWRHSWLSREVGALGLFGGVAVLAVSTDSAVVQGLAALAGLAGVTCSGMLYVVTRRPSWRATVTLPRFALGALVGGAAVSAATGGGRAAAMVLAGSLAAKLVWEGCVVWRLMPDRPPRRGMGPVPAHGFARFILGACAVALALDSTGGPAAVLALVAVLAGELIERSRFFTAASWTGMPGPKR